MALLIHSYLQYHLGQITKLRVLLILTSHLKGRTEVQALGWLHLCRSLHSLPSRRSDLLTLPNHRGNCLTLPTRDVCGGDCKVSWVLWWFYLGIMQVSCCLP